MQSHGPTIVFPDATPLLLRAIDALPEPIAGLTVHESMTDEDELVARVAGHAIVLNNESMFTEAVISRCPDLRSIVFLGTGAASYIDIQACERRGIAVHTIAGYGNRTVAEHTIALIFAVYRDIGGQQETMRAGGWRGTPLGELQGKVIGLAGLGGIGREVAGICRALGMTVLAWSRMPRVEADIRMMDLDEMVAQVDILSLHLLLTPETQGMFDASRLRRLRKGAVLINTARGALTDEMEIVRMLEDGHLAGAGIDVYSSEPLPDGHALRTAPNAVLTAHTGWQSPEAVGRLMGSAAVILREERERLASQ